MKPSEEIREFRKFLVFLNNLIGMQMETIEFQPRFAFALILGTIYGSMFANGCYENFNDPYKFIHAFTPASIILVIASKLYVVAFRHWQDFDPLMFKSTMEFYEKCERNPKYSEILSKRAAESKWFTKLFIFLTFLGFHLTIVITLILYVFTSQKVLIVYNYLPYTDPNETFYFFLNFTLLSLIISLAFVVFAAPDSFYAFYGYQTVPLVDVLCINLNDLAEDLRKLKDDSVKFGDYGEGSSMIVREPDVQAQARMNYDDRLKTLELRFIDIVKEHRDYDLYIQNMLHHISIPLFFFISYNSLSIGMCVVMFFTISMPLGVVGALLFTLQVAQPCIAGQIILHQNARIKDQILDFPWFEMSRSKQKVFLQFIHAVGTTTDFVVPLGIEVNVETFANVLNMSYSYFTYFWNMMSTN